tara:strand:+ start:2149 stop:2376 length:228 start_codon:yes stop_codon:yes gene_type:complete
MVTYLNQPVVTSLTKSIILTPKLGFGIFSVSALNRRLGFSHFWDGIIDLFEFNIVVKNNLFMITNVGKSDAMPNM